MNEQTAKSAITAAHFVIVSGALAGETLAQARCSYNEAREAARRGSYRTAYLAASRVTNLAS